MAQYDFTDYGVGYDTDEEERKRREQEAIADRMEMEAYSNPMAPVDPRSMSFGDVAGAYVNNQMNNFQNKLNNAGQMLSNPQAAFQQQVENEKRRLAGAQQQAQQQEAQQKQQEQIANEEVQSKTVKTYGDGSQEEVVKKQIPAQTVPTQQEQGQQAQQFQQQMQQFRPVAPSQLEPKTPVPQNLQAQGPISANQPMPNIGQPPTPGPAVNVASVSPGLATPPKPTAPVVAAVPTMAQMGMAQAQAQAQDIENGISQPPAEPVWVKKATDAGGDFYKLIQVATEHPESRDFIQDKAKQLFKSQTLKDEYEKLAKAAQNGDPVAQNKLLQLIKPDTGKPKAEVTLGDYAKAYMFSKMGLPHLAQGYEQKIRGTDTRFGQVTLNGTTWNVETDAITGATLRAKDKEGNYAAQPILDQIGASGTKFGAQSNQFTGGIHTVPNATGDGQDLVMPVQNSIDPTKSGFIYMSGPNKGKEYNGTATPQQQSIGASFQKALDKAMIDFRTAPSIAAAKAAREKAAILDPGDNSLNRAVDEQIQRMAPDIFTKLGTTGTTSTTQVDTAAVDRLDRSIAENQREIDRANKSTAVSPAKKAEQLKILNDERNKLLAQRQSMGGTSGTGGGKMAGGSLAQQESTIKTNEAVKEARLKPPATKEGEIEAQKIQNQNTANENYGVIKDVADLIRESTGSGLGTRVDTLAGFFGVGTKGADAIAKLNTMSYPFIYNIPRFEGPQGEKDVTIYEKAAGDFANPKLPVSQRLAALQGMVYLMKKYDKEGKNDWTFGGNDPTKSNKAQPGTKENPIKLK